MGMDLCHSFSCDHDKVKSEVRKSSLVTGFQSYVNKLARNYLKILCISAHKRYFILWYGWFNDTLAMCAASLGNYREDSGKHSSFTVKAVGFFSVFFSLLRLWWAPHPCSPVPWLCFENMVLVWKITSFTAKKHVSVKM